MARRQKRTEEVEGAGVESEAARAERRREMMDPINFVQAYHATREVHRDYVRNLGNQAEKAPEPVRVSAPLSRPISWLASILAAVPGERRLASALRRQA